MNRYISYFDDWKFLSACNSINKSKQLTTDFFPEEQWMTLVCDFSYHNRFNYTWFFSNREDILSDKLSTWNMKHVTFPVFLKVINVMLLTSDTFYRILQHVLKFYEHIYYVYSPKFAKRITEFHFYLFHNSSFISLNSITAKIQITRHMIYNYRSNMISINFYIMHLTSFISSS